MIKLLLNIGALIILMILLMSALSFIVISLMENNTTDFIYRERDSFRKYLCQIRHSIKEDWSSVWHGIVFFMLVLIVALGILIVLAYIIPLEKWSIWNIMERFFVVHPVIASLVGTLVGLVLTFILLRPRLTLKQAYLYRHINRETPFESLSFCIANIGLFPVYNVKASVFWLRIPTNTNQPNDKDFQNEWKTKRIEMFRPEINSINGILSNNNKTYSWHAEESVAQNKADRDKANKKLKESVNDPIVDLVEGEQLFGDTILCRVQATHGLSGITKVYEWKIDANDIEGYKDIKPLEVENVVNYKLSVEKSTGKVEIKPQK